MSLRARLIVAFLVLSVVPLSAVTLIWYVSAVRTFERAAEREANDTARDIGRRMEMVTASLGRRMDRMFDEAIGSGGRGGKDGAAVEERVAPMLGDAAALVERLEFHPADLHPDVAHPEPNPNPHPSPPGPPHPPGPPPPPPAPRVIVVDMPKVLQEAQRAATEAAARAGVDVSAIVADAIKQSLPAVQQGIAGVNDAVAREMAAAAAKKPQMAVSGRRIEVPVWKGGKMVGKANAMLNMDRTLQSVLSLARREQGEIPFAIDQQGALHTPDAPARATLESLRAAKAASAAAGGAPQRLGDWIVVARKDPGGLIFGIARPIGNSLREIRRSSLRNLSLGLLVIVLACIGIVPISHRMTQHLSSLSDGVRQLAGGDFKARVPVRSKDEFGIAGRRRSTGWPRISSATRQWSSSRSGCAASSSCRG